MELNISRIPFQGFLKIGYRSAQVPLLLKCNTDIEGNHLSELFLVRYPLQMVESFFGFPFSHIIEPEVVVCHGAVRIEPKGFDQVFKSQLIVAFSVKNTGNIVVDGWESGIYG